MFIKGKSSRGIMPKSIKQKYILKTKRRSRAKRNITSHTKSLIFAIESNDIGRVKLLVEKGIDVNKSGKKMTPIHVAAYYDRPSIIYFLWENGAYVDPILTRGKMEGFTPLHLAVQKNHLECVKVLLNLGATVTSLIEGVYHPIYYAIFNNFVDVACELLQHRSSAAYEFDNNFFEENPVTMDRSLWLDHDLPLFHYSILQKHHKMLNALSFFVCHDQKTKLGKTPLMQAVEVNYYHFVKVLCDKNNVNDRDNFGQPVLHFTMINANRKASMYSKEEHAMLGQKLQVLKILIDNGADVYARFPENEEHSSIIHYMMKYGFSNGVLLLLFECGDYNFNSIDMSTLKNGCISFENLTPDIKDDRHYLMNLRSKFAHSKYFIILKAMTLKMIGLPVDENLILKRPFYPWITIENHRRCINYHNNKIMQEITLMKETKVGDTNITIHDLLTCEINKLIKLMSNESVRNFLVKDYDEKVFHYFIILEKRLNYAKNKRLFLDETTELLAAVLINRVPFDCCKQIVSFIQYNYT